MARKFDKKKEEVVKKKWVPKTQLGRDVLAGKITSIDDVVLSGKKIMEAEITDYLVPDIEIEYINVGQAKGKFGGGRRKSSRATQKITKDGSSMSFSMLVVAGNRAGVVGYGFGKASETVPAREKAIRKSKQNLIIIRRGSGDWGSSASSANSIPFAVMGKCGSVVVKLMPAPVGTGLVCEKEMAKLLSLAGISDVWSKTYGSTKNKINLIMATVEALKNLQTMKLNPMMVKGKLIKEGEKDEQ